LQREVIAKASNVQEHLTAPNQSEERWPYTKIFQRQIKEELGENTVTRFILNPQNFKDLQNSPNQFFTEDFFNQSLNPSLWVLAPDLGENWLEIKLYPRILNSNKFFGLIVWMGAIVLLALLMSYIFVRKINAPFLKLTKAIKQLGKGQHTKLDLQNMPNEILYVYKSFNKMIENLIKTDQERAVMLAGISHDLRSPLTRLRISLELLKDDVIDDWHQKTINFMIEDIEASDQIIGQFIEYASSVTKPKKFTKSDLTPILQSICDSFNKKNNYVSLNIPKALPLLDLNSVSINRMFYNLLHNSFKYGANKVQINAFIKNNNLIIEVIDDGFGINPEIIDKVLVPFVRSDTARTSLGAGLGLSIVEKICEQHQGKIKLQNLEPKGLKVTVWLPIKT